MKTQLLLTFTLLMLCLCAAPAQETHKPVIYFIGDSQVCYGQDDGAQGLWGWGSAMTNYFDQSKVRTVNRASGHASSRTFYTQPELWAALLREMKTGDYLFIQFSVHESDPLNDATYARGTLPGTGNKERAITHALTGKKETIHTYGWYLRQFVREAKLKGVTPLICSPAPRNVWSKPTLMKSSDPYAQSAREVASQEKVFFIDLQSRSRAKMEEEGAAVAKDKYYLPTDPVHSTALGAMLHALSATEEIRTFPGYALIPYLLDKPSDAFPKRKKLYIIGDSTVQDGNAPIAGWGGPIREMFDTTRLKSYNRSRGARSSQTYHSEGLWELIRSQLRPGDFVLVGFGHNDGATLKGTGDEIRVVTKRDGTPDTIHTYGWNMRKFVRDTKAAGAIPILFSQIPWGSLREGKAPRVTDTYAKWLREVAESEQVGFVDLNDLLATKYEALGDEEVRSMSQDGAHTNKKGALFNALTMIEGLCAIRSPLADYVLPAYKK